MDALRGGLVIPKGMTGLATGAGGGSIPSARGKKHAERVSYFAGIAATETPAAKPGVQIPGQQRPLTSNVVNSPWWSPERLRQTLEGLVGAVAGSSTNHLFSLQTVAAVVAFLFVATFLVIGIVAETRSRSPSGGFGMRGVGIGAAVTTGGGGDHPAGVGAAADESSGGGGGGRKTTRDMFGGAFTQSWIQPSRMSGHEHAKSKLYNIIAPSPPPPGFPPLPPPPAPMMDFQRWCMAAQVLVGDQLLFAPIKQYLTDQGRMTVGEPLGRQVMREWLAGKTVLNQPFKQGNKNLQALVADMYVYLRENEVSLTRKTKCLLYRAQQVFGFVGAPWTGTMNDKEMAKAEEEAKKFLKSVGFLRTGDTAVTRARLKEFLYGKTVNGKVWVQGNKSKKEELADLLDYRDVAEGRAIGYREYGRAAAANPLGLVGGGSGMGMGMGMGGGGGGFIRGGGGGGGGMYDAGGYQQPQQQAGFLPQQQQQQLFLLQQQQQQQQQRQQRQQNVGGAAADVSGVVETEREVLTGFHKYLQSLDGEPRAGKDGGHSRPMSPEQLLHHLQRYVEDRKSRQQGMSGMLADNVNNVNDGVAGTTPGAGVGVGAAGSTTGWDAAGQALIANLRRQMDPARAAAADQSGMPVGAVQPGANIVGGQDPMVDDAVRELLAGVGNGDMGQMAGIKEKERQAAAAAAAAAATGHGHIPLGGDGLRVTTAEGVEVTGSESLSAMASARDSHEAMGSALASLMTSPPNPPFPPENPPPPPPDYPEPPMPDAPVAGQPWPPRAPKPPPSPPPPRSTEVEDMEKLKRAAALLADAKNTRGGGGGDILREAKADVETSWKAEGNTLLLRGEGNRREGDDSYHSLTLVSAQKLSRAASVGLAVGFAGGLLWVLREHASASAAVAAGTTAYVLGVIPLGAASWLPVLFAVLAALVAAGYKADWSAIHAALERVPDTYKPFSRVGRPVGDGALSKTGGTLHVSGYTGRPVGQSSEIAAGLSAHNNNTAGGGGGGTGTGGTGRTFFGGGNVDAGVKDAVMQAEMSSWQRRRQMRPGQMGELVRGVLTAPDAALPAPHAVGDIFGPPPGAVTTGMGVVIAPVTAPVPKPGDGSFLMGGSRGNGGGSGGGGGGGGFKPPGMSGGF